MQDHKGKRIKSSLRGVTEEIHLLPENAAIECFEFKQDKPSVWTCVLTREKTEESGSTNVEVEFHTSTGVLISEYFEDYYTPDLRDRDNQFFESVLKSSESH